MRQTLLLHFKMAQALYLLNFHKIKKLKHAINNLNHSVILKRVVSSLVQKKKLQHISYNSFNFNFMF